jgi:hypothetical protein
MNATNIPASPTAGVYNAPAFWERLWRMSGIGFVAFALVVYAIYGNQPKVGASADAVAAFFAGNRSHFLIAVIISGMAVLNLLWFAAALRTTLADAGRDGWGAAVTAASGAVGVLFFLLAMVVAALAYSIASSGNGGFTSGLGDLLWSGVVLSSFPRAMLIMAGSFGLWRAGLFSNVQFGAGVAALLLVLLGGTTWMSDGFWAPDGAYSRYVSPLIGLVWILGVSRILVASPATRSGW